MDRETAVKMAQQAIKAKNKRLVDAVLALKAESARHLTPATPISGLPLIAVTCATGWECYAIVEELTKTRQVPCAGALPDAGHAGGSTAGGAAEERPKPSSRVCCRCTRAWT